MSRNQSNWRPHHQRMLQRPHVPPPPPPPPLPKAVCVQICAQLDRHLNSCNPSPDVAVERSWLQRCGPSQHADSVRAKGRVHGRSICKFDLLPWLLVSERKVAFTEENICKFDLSPWLLGLLNLCCRSCAFQDTHTGKIAYADSTNLPAQSACP